MPEANIFRDVGVSGGTGTNSRAGWRALDAKLAAGDTLVVVAIDRIGRRWMDTVNAMRDLRTREVKIPWRNRKRVTWTRSCRGGHWRYSDHLHGWAAEQEMQAVSRRTRAGLVGPPRIIADQVDHGHQAGRAEPPVHGGFSEYRALRCNGGCRKL